eukprot:CAMPEP_0185753222 /NCGR_PEP_ID=MMETSP1174-20130828/11949_1 /TAXON_ID=35687 /ORGANISM="Dictyocha speculum, Strain CCMP1381" /LENGTH=125 /DNA_ID=CAMNT_0028430963 /DNA_START=103 /DNA_END=480 /DNA_ORIENTATION=+
MLVILEAILFGLFTLCMLCDQCNVLTSNETKIDRLKGEKHQQPTVVNEIFGSVSDRGRICTCLVWLLPFKVSFPRDMRDEVLGFTVTSPKDPEEGNMKPLRLQEQSEGNMKPLLEDPESSLLRTL